MIPYLLLEVAVLVILSSSSIALPSRWLGDHLFLKIEKAKCVNTSEAQIEPSTVDNRLELEISGSESLSKAQIAQLMHYWS